MVTVGKIIFDQLQVNKMKFLSWGAGAFKAFDENTFNKDLKHLGGLIFKVKGHHFKGHVMIRLNFLDYYNVNFGRLVKGEFLPSDKIAPLVDVDCFELANLIDERIEKIKEYVF
jgi:hypothetical protein